MGLAGLEQIGKKITHFEKLEDHWIVSKTAQLFWGELEKLMNKLLVQKGCKKSFCVLHIKDLINVVEMVTNCEFHQHFTCGFFTNAKNTYKTQTVSREKLHNALSNKIKAVCKMSLKWIPAVKFRQIFSNLFMVTFCFVVDQKSVGGALSSLDYNYKVLWQNLHMAGLF